MIHKTIDDLCVWKALEQNSDSTTFEDVRNDSKHILYPCIDCYGTKLKGCENYYKLKDDYK